MSIPITATGAGGWGLYNDEGSSDITLENNLVYNVQTGLYHQHYGEGNLIQNNILAFSLDGQLQRSRVEDRPAFTFRRNIVLWNRGPLLNGSWQKNTALDHNLYWDTSGAPVTFEGKTLAQWQAGGKDAGSLVADPGFVAAGKAQLRLPTRRPQARLARRPDRVPALRPGPRRRLRRRGLGASGPRLRLPVRIRPRRTRPPRRRSSFHQDFEDLPVGAACPDAQTNGEGDGASIQRHRRGRRIGRTQPQIHRRAGPGELLMTRTLFSRRTTRRA